MQITYRNPEAEQVVVALLSDEAERERFLSNREQFVSEYNLSDEARGALMSIEADRIRNIGAEVEYAMAGDVQGYVKTKPCQNSTFADLFCDS